MRGSVTATLAFIACLICCALASGPARADVFGRLRIIVRGQQPTHPRGEHGSVTLESQGGAFTPMTVPAPEARTFPPPQAHFLPAMDYQVTLRDSADVRGDITVTTGKDGSVLSPLLEDRKWLIVRVAAAAKGQNLLTIPQAVRVNSDTTADVTIAVDVAKNAVIDITVGEGAQTAIVYHRDRAFIQRYPSDNGNPQSLGRILQTVPGVTR